jgi:hypothetical protein
MVVYIDLSQFTNATALIPIGFVRTGKAFAEN